MRREKGSVYASEKKGKSARLCGANIWIEEGPRSDGVNKKKKLILKTFITTQPTKGRHQRLGLRFLYFDTYAKALFTTFQG